MDVPVFKKKHDQVYIEVDGPLFGPGVGKFWISTTSLGECLARGQKVALAQFYKMVMPGLILTRHIFEGLARPLFCDGEMEGDKDKFAFSRTPAWDWVWSGGAQGVVQQKRAPEHAVFVVLVSKNKHHRENFPEVDGWIERWNWVEEDAGLAEAPVGWVDRYVNKIWTRGLP